MAFETLKENGPFNSERKCLLWRDPFQTLIVNIKIFSYVIGIH